MSGPGRARGPGRRAGPVRDGGRGAESVRDAEGGAGAVRGAVRGAGMGRRAGLRRGQSRGVRMCGGGIPRAAKTVVSDEICALLFFFLRNVFHGYFVHCKHNCKTFSVLLLYIVFLLYFL